jgi:type IV secretory pathway TrbF-like protein
LLGAFQGLGVGLGLAARISPKPISELVTRIIDDAASQQFNDAIRDIQKIDPVLVNEDVKETLKYHRDLKASSENSYDGSSSSESTAANTGINSVAVDPLSVLMTPEKLKEITFVLSSSLSNVLHFTRSL